MANINKVLPTRGPIKFAQVKGERTLYIETSSFTGCKTKCTVEATEEQYLRWQRNEDHVQNIFPLMDTDSRELFVSGMGPREFNALFGD